MSEEEIINVIKEIIEQFYVFPNPISIELEDNKVNALEGLLDLYNKEKEKNRILEDLLQGKLYELYLYYKDLAGSYQANSISKDKIKQRIKELEKQDKEIRFSKNYLIIPVLKELLEEG